MSLQENLTAAEAAITYIKGLGIQAINRRSDRIAASGGIENVVGTSQGQRAMNSLGPGTTQAQLQDAAGPLTASFVRARFGGAVGDNIRDNVARYVQERAGNCAEQAEIAMLYLWDNYHTTFTSVSMMSFTAAHYDHVWVVIDLDADYARATPPNGMQNLRNWGANAVWCDSWQGDGVAFAVQDLVKGKVRNLNAIYKCNTADAVAAGVPVQTLYYGP